MTNFNIVIACVSFVLGYCVGAFSVVCAIAPKTRKIKKTKPKPAPVTTSWRDKEF